jgi:hypothetical protein
MDWLGISIGGSVVLGTIVYIIVLHRSMKDLKEEKKIFTKER